MKKYIKILLIVLIVSMCSGFVLMGNYHKIYANPVSDYSFIDGDYTSNYEIYDEFNNYLINKSGVSVGDAFINENYNKYEIVYLNNVTNTGIAKFIEKVEKPKVIFSETPSRVSVKDKKIGLYLTHNDESYLPTDGYYTVYGKGGVHDVAKSLKNSFEKRGVQIVLDETLHLPHDAYAYSRSKPTAQKLLKNNNLDALFDVHRDGVPKSFYLAKTNGEEFSKVRIVVGKANSKVKDNEKFAIYLRAVADELYPWLISDIYYATGHYNQNLFEKGLLLEMGTYLIEKELVLKSIDPLTHVVNVALYNTTVNEKNNQLEIGGNPTQTTPLIKDVVGNGKELSSLEVVVVIMFGMLIMLLLTYSVILFIQTIKKLKKQ